MNIEQAVQNLEDIKSKYTWSTGADDALDMAIKALREQDLQPACNQLATDTISRQAAIDLAHSLIIPNKYKYELYNQAINNYCVEIMGLPSAQPEIKPIDYQDCANAMLRMWMDEVITDGEYNRIMNKLNAFWMAKHE